MTKRTPAGDAFSLVAVKILHLNELFEMKGTLLAAKAGQNSARWRVLAATEMKLMTVAEIARALGLARQSVQRLADALTEEGLTAYKENPSDKRAMHLTLTASGKKTLAIIQLEQRKWANEMGGKLGMGPLKALDENLRELLITLKQN